MGSGGGRDDACEKVRWGRPVGRDGVAASRSRKSGSGREGCLRWYARYNNVHQVAA